MVAIDSTVLEAVNQFALPFIRISAMLMVAPIFGAKLLPTRVKVIFSLVLSLILVPIIPIPQVSQFPTLLQVVQELLVGIAMGFVVQLVFDAMVLGGQAAAMSMGLGFAFFIDSQRGINVPIVSQFFLIMTTLVFLSMNGHLLLISTLAESFKTLPPGDGGLTIDAFGAVAAQGTMLFVGAVKLALPAVVSLLAVNIAFGVVSRAAPTLNLFAVGFPVTMLLGFLVLQLSFGNLGPNLAYLFDSAFSVVQALVDG